MAEDQRIPPVQNQSLKPNQMVVVGRLDRVSKYENRFEHVVTCPAPDEFSKPSVIRVQADSRLGDVGELLKVLCVFVGWPNFYPMTDKETGEKRTVYDTKGFFQAVQ